MCEPKENFRNDQCLLSLQGFRRDILQVYHEGSRRNKISMLEVYCIPNVAEPFHINFVLYHFELFFSWYYETERGLRVSDFPLDILPLLIPWVRQMSMGICKGRCLVFSGASCAGMWDAIFCSRAWVKEVENIFFFSVFFFEITKERYTALDFLVFTEEPEYSILIMREVFLKVKWEKWERHFHIFQCTMLSSSSKSVFFTEKCEIETFAFEREYLCKFECI